MVEYSLIDDPQLQARVRRRYERDISYLKQLDFQILGYALERETPFSAILQFPRLFLMWMNGEVLTFPSPLRIGVATALLTQAEPSTVALCMGMGVKLYTRFADDTVLISCTFQSYLVPKPGSKIIKPPPASPAEAAWRAHADRVRQMETASQRVRPIATYAEFLEVSRLEEDITQYEQGG